MLTIEIDKSYTRELDAERLVERLVGAGLNLNNQTVCISSREDLDGSVDFVHALFVHLMLIQGATKVVLLGCSRDFIDKMMSAARQHHLAGQIWIMDKNGWFERTYELAVDCICNGVPCVCGAATRDRYLRNPART